MDFKKLEEVLHLSTHVYVEEPFSSPRLAKLARHRRALGSNPRDVAFSYLQGIHDHFETMVTIRDLETATIKDGALHFEKDHLTFRFVKEVFENVPLGNDS